MTETSASVPAAKPPLGIGDLIGSTFRVFFARLPFFFLSLFVPYLVLQILFVFGLGYDTTGTVNVPTREPNTYLALSLVYVAVFWSFILLIQGVQARAAVSFQLGEGLQIGPAIRAALVGFFPILIMGLLAAIGMGVGFLFLIVPGLYLTAMFYLLVPAIVFENKGFGGLQRSVELTSGYRWAIVGLVLVLVLIGFLIALVIGAGIVAAEVMLDPNMLISDRYSWVLLLTDAVITAVTYPISMIAAGLTFVRLREIKEGGGTDDLLKIFE